MKRTPSATRASGEKLPAVSLRGVGRVQRRIWRAFMAMPERELTTAQLAAWCYPRLEGKPLKRHRTAIVRAAARMAERVRRDRPGGVVFRAFGSNAVATEHSDAVELESAQ